MNGTAMSNKGIWMFDDSFTDQVVFDLRTPVQRAIQSEFKSDRTFKKELDIWEDKPQIIASEEVFNNLDPNSVI